MAKSKKTTSKKVESKKGTTKKKVELNPRENYKIVGTGKDVHIKKGAEYETSGEIAQILINKGSATLK